MSTKPIIIVQGGQYGSEAKGLVAGFLCKERSIEYAVRTGATNAGHTVHYNGKPVKLQQLPVGFVNPRTSLVIGPGALIDTEILRREIEMLSSITGTDIRRRVFIDSRAGIHLPEHTGRSAVANRHHAIGATGKGCSEALIDRIRLRGRGHPLFGSTVESQDYQLTDTEELLNTSFNGGASILLEGTQGQGLDLCLGPYPYTTHKQTGPAQWMLEAGLSPALPTEIVAVMRVAPIRVAGNSGPMQGEVGWPLLVRSMNEHRAYHGLPALVPESSLQAFEGAVRTVARAMAEDGLHPSGSDGLDQHEWPQWKREQYQVSLSELHARAIKSLPADVVADLMEVFEMTTVTAKLRRIAEWSSDQAAVSARQIRPHWVALTFMNYLHPEKWYTEDATEAWDSPFIKIAEGQMGVPVRMVSYGPADVNTFIRHRTT